MSTIFGGGELPSFNRFNATETILAGTFNAPARCGIHTKKGGWIVAKHSALNDLWYHFDMNVGLVTSTLTPIIVKNTAGTVLFSISSAGEIKVGGSQIGSAPIFTQGLFTIDIHLRNGASGLVEVYAGKQVVFSAAGNFALSGMASLTLSPIGQDATDTTNSIWSQVIVDDEPTIGFQLATLAGTAIGDLTDWIGGIEKVNEVVLDDTTFINASTSGLINTYQVTDLDSSYTNVKAVIISALGRYASVGPKNLDAVVRVGGVNYLSTMTPIGSGFTASQSILHTNPATSLPWTNSDVSGAQLGIRSKV